MPFDTTHRPTVTFNEAVAQTIEAGIERIRDPRKWCKMHFYGYDDTYCIVGSIHTSVSSLLPYSLQSISNRILNLFNQEAANKGFSSVIDFNDAPATTHAEVIELMQAAANKARE